MRSLKNFSPKTSLERNFVYVIGFIYISTGITFFSYTLRTYKIYRKSKINNDVINQMIKFKVFVENKFYGLNDK